MAAPQSCELGHYRPGPCGAGVVVRNRVRVRLDIDPQAAGTREFGRFINAVVVPRPIAWISTISADGIDNLAPHSYFNIASTVPPVVQFSSTGRKDTLRNVEQTGEFVISLATEPMLDEINASSAPYPAQVSEFDATGVERRPSVRVRPPGAALSPVILECELHSTTQIGDATVVFGTVVHATVAPHVLTSGHPDVTRLRPLARLGKDEWSTIGQVLSVTRPQALQ